MRQLFGGTASDFAEDAAGTRVPGAIGTVWDGPSTGAQQYTDLTTADGAPMYQLTADSRGFVPAFFGPDGVERLWVDFGAGRVALTSVTVGERLDAHTSALDPHGDRAYADGAFLKNSGNGLEVTPDGKAIVSHVPHQFTGPLRLCSASGDLLGELYAEGGALKWRSSAGTVTTIAPA
ncbi:MULTISPECIES: hypothetical protein [Streptomycetaceae]|uniref:Glycerophosphoryl diester phosphodiesterase n=1 Tax=Streptantibioticus cattleyicolor (strain ATCC 35852 / DSM 46488 / JCM 4925 / NBRC 14057 / NRRL 8057) TaxID=1003195 RepID=F8JPZ6_STREN|nr:MULTISPECIES: hypothetical protein [Streptomycetaceae]AEW94056.1 glycerophosphoryl diester phosphodiesterase [Streptantibioticus cattleyicolor NRRL 8057 = DSM 46488]MYS58729.1 glycerophosphodiester phosphodiesterase [Streptomyces sp. SID5468]CCB74408.1 protein of unknown function [Streptantibioticus cattleyicolor NRRL 8057 = DSM 46488]